MKLICIEDLLYAAAMSPTKRGLRRADLTAALTRLKGRSRVPREGIETLRREFSPR